MNIYQLLHADTSEGLFSISACEQSFQLDTTKHTGHNSNNTAPFSFGALATKYVYFSFEECLHCDLYHCVWRQQNGRLVTTIT
jgi:hypothetical protein